MVVHTFTLRRRHEYVRRFHQFVHRWRFPRHATSPAIVAVLPRVILRRHVGERLIRHATVVHTMNESHGYDGCCLASAISVSIGDERRSKEMKLHERCWMVSDS